MKLDQTNNLKMLRSISGLILVLSLLGCAAGPQQGTAAPVVELSPELCNKVEQMVALHATGFDGVAGRKTPTKWMDISTAKYHLVGNDCQIWQWKDGRQVYVCSQAVPDTEQAVFRHKRAADFTAQCLGDAWQAEESVGKTGNTFKTVFSRPDSKTVATINRVKTGSVARDMWTLYYFIGDRDPSL